MMEAYRVSVEGGHIHYYRFGKGPERVVCFHGYGENGESFRFLEDAAGETHSFYCMDLPFHGKTEWPEGKPFLPADLLQCVRLMLEEKEEKYMVMGFSLGGRVALSLYEAKPGKVKRMVLLAPDGLKVNFWYWLSTQTMPGNRFFRFTMRHPGWFLGLLKLINRLRLVNRSIYKFVAYYIGDAEIRNLLYWRWTTLRKLRPRLDVIKSLINKNGTATRLVYGRHDRIILSSVGNRFIEGIEGNAKLDIIESGHQVLHAKHVEDILAALIDH